jgi:hypothetical protein
VCNQGATFFSNRQLLSLPMANVLRMTRVQSVQKYFSGGIANNKFAAITKALHFY